MLTEWTVAVFDCDVLGGELTPQDGEALTSLGTDDGRVLLFNCHVSSSRARKVEYPAEESALKDGEKADDALIQELRNHVSKEIGPIAKPKSILVVPELPKTVSGKIVKRDLRDRYADEAGADV